MKTAVVCFALLACFSSRAFAHDFYVNVPFDAVDNNVGDGRCWTGASLSDGTPVCTLRAAIQESNFRYAIAHVDAIHLGPGEYFLSIAADVDEDFEQLSGHWDIHQAAAVGDLDVDADIWIIGAGADVTTINGRSIDRVLDVWALGLTRDIQIQDVTIMRGLSSYQGGCIHNRGRRGFLWIGNTVIQNCIAREQIGGGIFNHGYAFLEHVTFRFNGALRGGAMENGYFAQIRNSTFENNGAMLTLDHSGDGGAISNLALAGPPDSGVESPFLHIISTTFSSNSATNGGAILNSGRLGIENSTISGNRGHGAGIMSSAVFGGAGPVELEIVASTIANNEGQGIWWTSGTASVRHSIIANNRDPVGALINCLIPLTGTDYVLEDGTTCGLTGEGDLSNTDPMLGPLADNGGQTMTHALLRGSPAIDAIRWGIVFDDQRGIRRPIGGYFDIGAFEYGIDPALLTVLVPIRWRDVFLAGFTLSAPVTFSASFSLADSAKSDDDFSKAKIVAAKPPDGQQLFKVDLAKDGSTISLSGLAIPPKAGETDKNDPVLFYLAVQRGLRGAAELRTTGGACDCAGKSKLNPAALVIPPYGSIRK